MDTSNPVPTRENPFTNQFVPAQVSNGSEFTIDGLIFKWGKEYARFNGILTVECLM